jgi:hypothetical protein
MTHWRAITSDKPAPLNDVLVSVLLSGESKPSVFHAWRGAHAPSRFHLTGTEQVVPGHVYAFAAEPAPAPVPADLLVAP